MEGFTSDALAFRHGGRACASKHCCGLEISNRRARDFWRSPARRLFRHGTSATRARREIISDLARALAISKKTLSCEKKNFDGFLKRFFQIPTPHV